MRAVLVLFWKELVYLRAYPLNLLNQAVSPALLVAPYILVARMFGFDEGSRTPSPWGSSSGTGSRP